MGVQDEVFQARSPRSIGASGSHSLRFDRKSSRSFRRASSDENQCMVMIGSGLRQVVEKRD